MGKDSEDIIYIVVGLVCVTAGIAVIVGSSLSIAHDWPEEKKGELNSCEQTYLCPGERARDGKVFYKGAPGLVASLAFEMPNVSQAFNRTVIDKSGKYSSHSYPFYQSFYLVRGSTVKWDIHGIGLRLASFFFYKERSYPCRGVYCGPYTYRSGFDFTGSYTVDDDGKYYVEVSVPYEENYETSFKMKTCSFEVLHHRYFIEDVEVERKDTNGTFSIEMNGTKDGCVFVEYPCNNVSGSQPREFILGHHLKRSVKLGWNIIYIIGGGLLCAFGVTAILVGFSS